MRQAPAGRGAIALDLGQPISSLLAGLAPSEREWIGRLPTERQRRQSALGRIAAHSAAEQVLGPTRKSSIVIRHGQNGEPLVTVDGEPGLVNLSFSHSGRLAVAVAWRSDDSDAASMGIDLERARTTELDESTYAFSLRERELIRESCFGSPLGWLAAWMVKEAAWKAMRPEPDCGPDTVEIQTLDLASGYATVRPQGALRGRFGNTSAFASLGIIEGAEEAYLVALAQLNPIADEARDARFSALREAGRDFRLVRASIHG